MLPHWGIKKNNNLKNNVKRLFTDSSCCAKQLVIIFIDILILACTFVFIYKFLSS